LSRARLITVVLGTALLLAPTPVRADDNADEADFRFRRGAELYARRDFAGALSEFFTSNRLVHNRNVVFNIARTLEQLGRVEEAYRDYAALGEEELPPADRREVEASLRRLSARVALVRVESDPPGATIFVERRDLGGLGQTPRTLALPPRPTQVILDLPGHEPVQRAIAPTTGHTVTLKLSLPTIYGALALTTHPADAEVHLDAEGGPLLAREGKVVPGRHQLWVRAPGHVTQMVPVEVAAQQTTSLQIDLATERPPVGALVVRANLDGALISIDGKESGFTPGVIEGVVAGAHVVTVEAEGRERFRAEVTVPAEGRSFVDAHLRSGGERVEAATKSLRRASDAPGSITVISPQELRAFGYQTLGEALRAVRGIYFSDDRTYTYVGFRGFSPLGDFNSRVLILLDGHTVADPWVDQAYVGREFDVDLETVERVEVVRGGGSALYGTGAIFGVINVVQRPPGDGAHGDLEGGLGTLGEAHARATLSGGSGTLHALATAALADAQGDRAYLSPEPIGGQSISLTNDAERAFHAGLKLQAGDFSLAAMFNTRRKSSPTGQFGVAFPHEQRSTDTIGFVEARFDHGPLDQTHFTARAYYDGSRFRGLYNLPNPTVPEATQLTVNTGGADAVGAELRLQLPEVVRNRLSVGAEGQDRFRVFQTADTPGLAPLSDTHTEQVLSIYVNDEVRLSSWLTLTAGARLDDHLDSFGVVFTPRAALIAHPYEGATTKLLASRSFRAPTIYERYYADYVTQVPAPGLRPEVAQQLELEHTHPFTDELSATATLYAQTLTQLIDLEPRPDGLLQYVNTPGTVRTYGAELELRYRPTPELLVEGFVGATHVRSERDQALDNSPAQTGGARVMLPVISEALILASELLYTGPRSAPVDASGVRPQVGETLDWNLVVSGSVPRRHLRYQAGVFNLLDQHVELPAVGMPQGVRVAQYGRTLRLTLGFGF
jgi:outer membrane receptor for ferrienterochelin and colicins